MAIMLRRVPAPERISPNEKQGGTWDAFFWVSNARALHAELRASGAEMEESAVRDREGYVLGFGQTLVRPAPRQA